MRQNLGPGVDGWAISLRGMMSIVVILGLVIASIYWGVNKFVIDKASLPVERKKKVSFATVSVINFFHLCLWSFS
jgi:AAA family ATP:ADP antiporter